MAEIEHHSTDILVTATRHTWRNFKSINSNLVPLAMVAFLAILRYLRQGVDSTLVDLLFVAGIWGFYYLLVFLWHLTTAESFLIRTELGDLGQRLHELEERAVAIPERTPAPSPHWQERKTLTLWEAAGLMVNHEPVWLMAEQGIAAGAERRLIDAINSGDLVLANLTDALTFGDQSRSRQRDVSVNTEVLVEYLEKGAEMPEYFR